MRIAIVTTEYVTEANFAGGLANYSYRLARGLRELGHDAEVFVDGPCEASFEHDEITVHRLKGRPPIYIRTLQRLLSRLRFASYTRDVNILNRILTLRAGLQKRHRDRPFDLVHYTHLLGSGVLRMRLPSVVRLSSYRDLWHPFGFPSTSPFAGLLEDLALKRADAVFGPSHYVAEFVRSKLNVPVSIIESPFVALQGNEDLSLWEKHLRSRGRYGLYFGSLAEWKGVFVLSEALKTLLTEHPHLYFVFVGRNLSTRHGIPASESILGELAAFKDHVMRLDAMPHAQLFPIVRHADFVALPSLADNLPNTCLEAMALGTVVIGTRGRSFDQLIEDGVNGLLCEPGDITSLTNALRRAATMRPDDKERMTRLAQDRIRRLAPHQVLAELVEFYREVIDRKHWGNRQRT
jgi:glycogen(starch) synthase